MNETIKCIVCLKGAVKYTGHVRKPDGYKVTAGFCSQHSNQKFSPRQWYGGENTSNELLYGWYGWFIPEMGERRS